MRTIFLNPLSLVWRGLRIVARWWPVCLVAIVLFLASVPGRDRRELDYSHTFWEGDYRHGWPLTYLIRGAPRPGQYSVPNHCWSLATNVVEFAPLLLVVDVAVAASLLAGTAVATHRLRPWLRLRFSLRTMLAAVAVTSVMMAYGAAWVRDHREMARIVARQDVHLTVTSRADCPTWIAELLPAETPAWLTEITDLRAQYPLTYEHARLVQRALVLRPDTVELILDDSTFAGPWQHFLPRVRLCDRLSIYLDGRTRDLRTLGTAFGRLQQLQLRDASGSLVASDLLASLPSDRLEVLELDGAELTDFDLSTIAKFRRLRTLVLKQYPLRSDGRPRGHFSVTPLCSLTELEELSLGNCFFVDENTRLAALTKLRSLWLHGIENRGWRAADLYGLEQIEVVRFYLFPVKDIDWDRLLTLPRMRAVTVGDSGLTPAQVEALRRKYPAVSIGG